MDPNRVNLSSTRILPRIPILIPDHSQTSNQLILYHPPSHALSVQPHPASDPGPSRPRPKPLLLNYRSETPTSGSQTPIESIDRPVCPYCSQPLPTSPLSAAPELHLGIGQGYFRILEQAHEGSRPPSRGSTPLPSRDMEEEDRLDESNDLPARGYYERFFREECRLGMGAEGSVYLATHIIGGSVLGKYRFFVWISPNG